MEPGNNFQLLKLNAEIKMHQQYGNTSDALTAEAQVEFYVEQGLTSQQKIASVALDSTVRAAVTMQEYADTINPDLPTLVRQLRSQCNNFNAEKTLIAQAVTLDAIFNNLATQAACVGWNTNTDKAEQLLRLGLRAQNQCGKTLQLILQNQQNKLLVEAKNGSAKVDSGAEVGSIEGNPTMATLVCIEGGKNS
ncbi:MAG: hypothetical protein RLZZ419_1638 [Pseudomonadota bacterium]|jgi:hypothetical protein